ncbi:flagellar basal body rod protein FlgB [Vreelandella populi]|uniref:Flagellar basal body rod protein FlgB n=1 Tax=Vreelandella populi TaxID=2498858 RepID=A0A433L935_9GAMM|nr:flagellar basal body rod protein FlgB [Halomonas populi]RUR41410.1 flagellar basal body rod protein FlgB [Halomonas populi]RUR44186.1 flagellar basal body rod protein FlgB [Halomonas populi]RUR56177.1 flagellar basal body rod protein FlgB [Halomonas populi]
MIDQLESAFNFHQRALGLRQARHEVLAANIANADTPNYKARDIDFASELKKAVEGGGAQQGSHGGLTLSRTSEQHMAGAGPAWRGVGNTDLLYRIPDQPSLDGNTVDMDRERTQFADNAVRYQAALTIMNRRIQGLKNAMQPE